MQYTRNGGVAHDWGGVIHSALLYYDIHPIIDSRVAGRTDHNLSAVILGGILRLHPVTLTLTSRMTNTPLLPTRTHWASRIRISTHTLHSHTQRVLETPFIVHFAT